MGARVVLGKGAGLDKLGTTTGFEVICGRGITGGGTTGAGFDVGTFGEPGPPITTGGSPGIDGVAMGMHVAAGLVTVTVEKTVTFPPRPRLRSNSWGFGQAKTPVASTEVIKMEDFMMDLVLMSVVGCC